MAFATTIKRDSSDFVRITTKAGEVIELKYKRHISKSGKMQLIIICSEDTKIRIIKPNKENPDVM